MIVAKQFRWEGAHRLPWHDGLCKNNHGHSYKMEASVDGAVDARGMVLDFKVIKRVLKPLVEAWDHATLVAHDDASYLRFVREDGHKHFVFPFDTTAENLARFAADVLCEGAEEELRACGASRVVVRVYETETCYAEYARPIDAEPATPAEYVAEALRGTPAAPFTCA